MYNYGMLYEAYDALARAMLYGTREDVDDRIATLETIRKGLREQGWDS